MQILQSGRVRQGPRKGGENVSGYEGDYFWWNNGVAERCVFRGGYWDRGTNAGVFYLYGYHSRSDVSTGLGFRSAYIPEIG